jgi:hypothetical protein
MTLESREIEDQLWRCLMRSSQEWDSLVVQHMSPYFNFPPNSTDDLTILNKFNTGRVKLPLHMLDVGTYGIDHDSLSDLLS